MPTPDRTRQPVPLADIIPDPDTVRAHLARIEAEASLLRRQLRLALRRQREAERLAGMEEVVHAK
jgi:hypothetical protein